MVFSRNSKGYNQCILQSEKLNEGGGEGRYRVLEIWSCSFAMFREGWFSFASVSLDPTKQRFCSVSTQGELSLAQPATQVSKDRRSTHNPRRAQRPALCEPRKRLKTREGGLGGVMIFKASKKFILLSWLCFQVQILN